MTLTNNFNPDPQSAQLRAGGDIDASLLQARQGFCGGFIANEPDYKLTYNAGNFPLILRALSANDTTMVVRTPDGAYYCDDDSAGNLNPLVGIERPQSGDYHIWVGTFEAGTTYPPATLEITEIGEQKPNGMNPVRADVSSAPFTGTVYAGGFFPVASRSGAEACFGLVGLFADAEIVSSGDIDISARSSSDTTLAVRGPNGVWYCDDDSGGDLNPSLSITGGGAGTYTVFVGTFAGGTDYPQASLTVSRRGAPQQPAQQPAQQPTQQQPVTPVTPDGDQCTKKVC